MSILRATWLILAGCGLWGCAGQDPGQAGGEWVLPESSRQSYRLDCRAACAVAERCAAWPEDLDCSRECAGMSSKGGLQAAYLEGWAACLLELPEACSQQDLDACQRMALADCRRPAELDLLAEAWCSRWLECNGAPVGAYLERCLAELDTLPDMALLACMSPEALDAFLACADAADCDRLSDQPLLQLCWSVYW